MKADGRFLSQPKSFWANVRSISENLGYTNRTTRQIRVYTVAEMCQSMLTLGLSSAHIADASGKPTALGSLLHDYFQHRATVLNDQVEKDLMDVERAKAKFEELYRAHPPKWPVPLNKQKNEKSGPAYFSAIINILIEANIAGLPCNYDPRVLTTFTKDGKPLRTFARRVDGAFPEIVNPIAIWEIKEYYYTTTFGSRVADGVYETLLDGLEAEELRDHESVDVLHYLMVDAYLTWWVMGRSYLCRIVDMLHMGYVDEVLFGEEVVRELPRIVKHWVALEATRAGSHPRTVHPTPVLPVT